MAAQSIRDFKRMIDELRSKEMMGCLKSDVDKCVNRELKRALEEWPLFASDHEGYSVLNEELEEMQEEVEYSRTFGNLIWLYTKKNEPEFIRNNAKELKTCLINAACEAIQAAAMCEKILLSQDKRRKGHELSSKI